MKQRLVFPIAAAVIATGCSPSWSGSSTGPEPMPVPRPSVASWPQSPSYRVVETITGRTVSFASMIDRASAASVVFFGEQHDDPETHFVEFALLEGLGLRHPQVVLSLEMFERDVQYDLDRYLRGDLSETDFLAASRPWPRYATDYRPMVQLARARGWRVVAANIPRPLATAISRSGMRALDTLTTLERQRAAAALTCPNNDAYFRRFAAEMTGHSAGGGPPTASDSATAAAMTQRFYEAQCAKDETMAESIAREFMMSSRRTEIVLHVNGAFHSDYGQGTVERVRRRLPDFRTLVITAVPVDDPATVAIGDNGRKADYVIFTRAAKKPGG